MPQLTGHTETKPVKMLVLGDSGSGKTGALAALAKAGWNLRIADFDNGLDVLPQLLKDTPGAMERVHYFTFTDRLQNVGGKVIPMGMPIAASSFVTKLEGWKEGKVGEPGFVDYGKLMSWGRDTVFVLDSLTFFGLAELRRVVAINGRTGQAPWQSDWGDAMGSIENVLALLYSDEVKCHIVVLSHITYIEPEGAGEGAPMRGYPSGLGNKLLPKIPRYFNTVLRAKSLAQGTTTKRTLLTRPEPTLELKCPALGLPAEIPLDGGLVQVFNALGAFPPKA